MNDRQIECFLALARDKNFSRVAEALYITQPAITHQIKSLEKSFAEKGGIRERMAAARKSYRIQQTEAALELLREVYRELAAEGNQELMQKIEKAANILKERIN